MSHTYDYPRPAYTADIVILAKPPGISLSPSSPAELDLEALFVKRRSEPFKGRWAFPGGFVNKGETSLLAVGRELKEETGLRMLDLPFLVPPTQFHIYDSPERDPRGWVISVAYWALINMADKIKPEPKSDAIEAEWIRVGEWQGHLAFDHRNILYDALGRWRLRHMIEKLHSG